MRVLKLAPQHLALVPHGLHSLVQLPHLLAQALQGQAGSMARVGQVHIFSCFHTLYFVPYDVAYIRSYSTGSTAIQACHIQFWPTRGMAYKRAKARWGMKAAAAVQRSL